MFPPESLPPEYIVDAMQIHVKKVCIKLQNSNFIKIPNIVIEGKRRTNLYEKTALKGLCNKTADDKITFM
jgi:hypothetical protein